SSCINDIKDWRTNNERKDSLFLISIPASVDTMSNWLKNIITMMLFWPSVIGYHVKRTRNTTKE
ncbi:31279_t:CDS:2, partial [Racocetra persica]